jgi:hypothetical protein
MSKSTKTGISIEMKTKTFLSLIFSIPLLFAGYEYYSVNYLQQNAQTFSKTDQSIHPVYQFSPEVDSDVSIHLSDGRTLQLSSPDCRLPCILGMTPGKTKWAEVLEILIFGGLLNPDSITNQADEMIEIHNESEDGNVSLHLYRQSTYLGAIRLSMERTAGSLDLFTKGYQFRELTQSYGAPSSIELSFTYPIQHTENDSEYHLWINYAYLGFEIEYSGIMDETKICPSTQIFRQDIYIFYPGKHENLPWGNVNQSGRFYLDQTTTTDTQAYINAVNQLNESICFRKINLLY